MLVLTLSHKETILINTPEGDVRVVLCPAPRHFQVTPCPGQSLTPEPATMEQLAEHGGGKNWIVVDSAAGKIRIRRFARRRPVSDDPVPRPVRAQDKPEAASDEPVPHNCPLIIDAPKWMNIRRERLTDEFKPATESPKTG